MWRLTIQIIAILVMVVYEAVSTFLGVHFVCVREGEFQMLFI